MENKVRSLKVLKQRKMLLVVPLLTLPFVTILFWLLGGGKMDATSTEAIQDKGFNIQLPNPNLDKEVHLDKMNYYEVAQLDSVKLAELISKDPNYLRNSYLGDSVNVNDDDTQNTSNNTIHKGGLNTHINRDTNEEKVYAKLEALQRVINQPEGTAKQKSIPVYQAQDNVSIHSKDVDRLEQMMESMSQSDDEDPELQKLSGMLENILDIQHPARVEEKLRKTSEANRGQVFSVTNVGREDVITSLTNASNRNFSGFQSKQNGFYSFGELENTATDQNSIEAVIHENQTLVNGSTVKMRLNNPIFINGMLIPKDNFLFGVASLKGERLMIVVNSLRYHNSILPVELSVFDMDGLEGIYIPGAINRDVAKSSADRSIQTLGMTSLDDSFGAQAASMGIEAAKGLLSKKVKLVKVMVKAGYQILIKDKKQKEININ